MMTVTTPVLFYLLCVLTLPNCITLSAAASDSCNNPSDDNNKNIPLHIRSFIAYDSLQTSQEFAGIQEAATDHVNGMKGLLDGYQLCFGWNHTLVS